MAWQCAECNASGSDAKVEVVCHHCGKPLCQNDRVELLDDAFSDEPGDVPRFAFHCRECRQRHHSGTAIRVGGTEE